MAATVNGQKKQALFYFYIGPYIIKSGVEVVDALPLLAHAQKHALQYPSSVDDAVQYATTLAPEDLYDLVFGHDCDYDRSTTEELPVDLCLEH